MLFYNLYKYIFLVFIILLLKKILYSYKNIFILRALLNERVHTADSVYILLTIDGKKKKFKKPNRFIFYSIFNNGRKFIKKFLIIFSRD